MFATDLMRLAAKMEQNKWALLSLLVGPGGHAIVAAKKTDDHDSLSNYLTAQWVGDYFVAGNYDLTFHEALKDAKARIATLR